MTVPGGSAAQPPGNKRPSGSHLQARSTASAAATLSSASTAYSYADLNERERLASTTESQTELASSHLYLDLLQEYSSLPSMVRTDGGSGIAIETDCESNNDTLSCTDDSEFLEDRDDSQNEFCECFYYKEKRTNCNICPIFDETRLDTSMGDYVLNHVVSCLQEGIPYIGDTEENDLLDRFYVYQVGAGKYTIMDEHRYLDDEWLDDPVID